VTRQNTQRRALGVVRLSEWRGELDDSTSPERQRLAIMKKAAERGSKIIGWAEDLDVSASDTEPFSRPELGPWLRDRIDEYDEVVVWRLDRLVRKTIPDFADVLKWSMQHDKAIISATEDLKLDTVDGRSMALLQASFAEKEAEAISLKVSEARAFLRQVGRWGAGRPPYGYRTVPNPDGRGYVLALDPVTSEVVRDLVQRVLAGESPNSLAVNLNARGVLTPADYWRVNGHQYVRKTEKRKLRGKLWDRSAVIHILRSEALLGYAHYQGKTVIGDDGMPVMFTDTPLIEQHEWDQLQAILDGRATTRQRSHGSALLLGVVFCGRCGSKLYRWAATRPSGKTYSYYRCSTWAHSERSPNGKCSFKPVPADELESWVIGEVFGEHGHPADWPEMTKVFVPGEDHSAELDQVRRALDRVRRESDSGGYDYAGGDQAYADRVQRLTGRLKALSELPSRPATWELVPTGRTWRTAFTSAPSVEEQRALLLNAGVTVWARGLPDGAHAMRVLVDAPV